MINWNLLGIEPTKDLNVIKKAYAKQLPQFHPEDDPEGYQQLRKAYEEAIEYAKDEKTNWEEPITTESAPTPITPKESWQDHFLRIFNDIEKRIDIREWQKLLDAEAIWQIEEYPKVKTFITSHVREYPNLPLEIWQLLARIFDWQETDVDLIERNILGHHQFRYTYAASQTDIDHDLFFSYRDKVAQAILANNHNSAKQLLQRAKAIFDHDPDLLKMEGLICKELHEWQQAIQAYEKCLAIDPDDMDSYGEQIDILFQMGRWNEVIEHASTFLNHYPSNGVRLLMAKALIRLNRDEEAKNEIEQILSEDQYDIEAILLAEQLKNKRSNPFSLKEIIRYSKRLLPLWRIGILLVMTILFQISISETVKEYTGYSYTDWIKNGFQSKEIIEADTMELLRETVDNQDELVNVTIEDATHTGLYETVGTIEGKEQTGFFKLSEVKDMERLLGKNALAVYVGYVDDVAVPFTLQEKVEDTSYHESKTIVLNAEWNHFPDQALTAIKDSFNAHLPPFYQEAPAFIVEDKYLQTDHLELIGDTLPFDVYIYMLINCCILCTVLAMVIKRFRIFLGW
ncbi:J domain-containing protein [Gracilibacillus thailandensis]|uniref:Tetratricopeptide repeat protein n=1 Tax=Gracilibacillus thailandensis TaxID=563735 RepID=A0A6N7R336_9BACI|nr:J domain-containing protein [Gracilibacillus thailandensis]MRI66406.1 tetratricopeptide repeat protein [Gracilibacillus thailandensis]